MVAVGGVTDMQQIVAAVIHHNPAVAEGKERIAPVHRMDAEVLVNLPEGVQKSGKDVQGSGSFSETSYLLSTR